MIIQIVGKMNGASADADSASDGSFVHVVSVLAMPAECRDQGRMNVQDSQMKVCGDLQQAEETSEHDVIGLHVSSGSEDSVTEFRGSGEVFAAQHFNSQAGCLGALNAAAVPLTGNDQRNFSRQLA